jgi:hypothetical protein
MVRHAFSIVLLAAFTAGLANTSAAGKPLAGSQQAAGNTQFLVFNLAPAGNYNIRKNGLAAGSQVAAPAGSINLLDQTLVGDRYEFSLTGIQPVTPSRPAGFVASGGSDGCVLLTWTTAPAGDYVTDYSLLWGTSPGVYTDSLTVDRLDIIHNGSQSTHTRCGMPSGTFHFALRAHNSFDRWSPLSAPSTTTISNENTAGPVPPTNVRATESSFGCATVTWTRGSDPTIAGYRVYFGTRPRAQAAYADSIEAGDAASAVRCGFALGTYYFSVRAYTDVGVFSGYSREVSLAMQGADVAAPTITQRTPGPGATDVPLNAAIFFVATDDKTGVNESGIVFKVDGVDCAYSTTPTTGGFAVQCDPPGDFAPNVDVNVEITVTDNATPPNVAYRTWTFRTGTSVVTDTEAPVIAAVSPTDGATGVEARPTIEVRITDAGLGVNFSSIVLEVNGEIVAYTVEGTPASARVSYRPDSAFPADSEVQVRVQACDRAPTANCATPYDYAFTVRAATTALAEGQGAIVPNGYWASDPARPMEVRNLPRDWRVRIFDAAGLTVRHYENGVEGATWTWDFTNDDGRRVAPALYLVRVTDDRGAVQTTGRFLVQSQR